MKKKNLSQKDLVISLYEVVKDKFILVSSDMTKLDLEIKKGVFLSRTYIDNTYSMYINFYFTLPSGEVQITATNPWVSCQVPADSVTDIDITGLLKRAITVVKKLPDAKAVIKKEPKTQDKMFIVGNKLYKVLEVLDGVTNE